MERPKENLHHTRQETIYETIVELISHISFCFLVILQLRFEKWTFPCDEMKNLMKEQLNHVLKNDVLHERFVESFKAQVEK